jgi:hypothetical protein
MPNMKVRLFIVALAFGALALGTIKFFFPYGSRSCFLPCTTLCLRLYAAENAGWFPSAMEPTNALQQLVPQFMQDPDYLAGIFGNRKKMREAWRERGYLTTNDSSWVYVPGFREDDEPVVAILWESRGGVALNGIRRDGHAVGFTDGSTRQVPSAEWDTFLRAQDALRLEVLKKRHAESRQIPPSSRK